MTNPPPNTAIIPPERNSESATGGALGAPMRRRDFLASLLAAAAAGCSGLDRLASVQTQSQSRPNVILIYIDDLGYADLGCQGAADLKTPNIDSLAHSGVRFTSGYVTAPLCSPSRAGLMTGRYQQRFGHEHNTGNPARMLEDDIGAPTSEIMVSDLLKSVGYATGCVGKWHLGVRDKYHPLNRGFDEYFGHLGGAHSYLDWGDTGWGEILRGMKPAHGDQYLTDAFSREAVSFIQRHQRRPFFLYLAYNAVHTPMQAPQKYLDRFPGIADPKRRTLAAMLSAVDDGVGQILAALRDAGVEDDTLIFCISDNGGPTNANASLNVPLNGRKGSMLDGGIRVPFIVRRPARLPAGLVYDHPVSTLDVLPTALAAAGKDLPRDRIIDGVDLTPFLTGEKKGVPHDVLFWRMGPRYAVRKGEWKLVQERTGGQALFDLSADIGETKDLARERPEKLKELLDDHARWDSQMVDALWQWHTADTAPRQARPQQR